MSAFLIESPHTKEQCLHALDEVLAEGKEVLARYRFGCAAGDHTGYVMVDAENERAAREIVPVDLRSAARVIPLREFTPAEIAQYHAK
ncbi:MAG TPA: hypothetical protein VL400_24510 [Polyangiaceae bacterium]|jgi:hypothetical protein|nr:hypothetical protein [Polyangiaceae bacterium]